MVLLRMRRAARRLLTPSLTTSSVAQIDFHLLKECGARGVMFDKDNTLTRHLEQSISSDAFTALRSAVNTFGTTNVFVLSNDLGAKHGDDARVDAFEDAMGGGVKVLRHAGWKKPFGSRDALIIASSKVAEIDIESMVFVGDRVLTDVVFANRMKAVSVLVDPVDILSEPYSIRMARFIENRIRFAAVGDRIGSTEYNVGHDDDDDARTHVRDEIVQKYVTSKARSSPSSGKKTD